jgi:FkbM family methyltransferase
MLRRAKTFGSQIVGRRRELQRAPGSRVGVHELAGITFPDFLGLFVKSRNPDDFAFIQVGAYDGRSNDWLHDLTLRHGLRGILVEPQPGAFRELKKNYEGTQNLAFENIAISDHDGHQNLYVLKTEIDFLQYASQVASFSYEHVRSQLEMHLRKDASQNVIDEMRRRGLTVEQCIGVEVVETRTFTSLLSKHDVQRYDLLQIDTEGFDFEVIKLANLERVRPTLINYEHEHLSHDDQVRCWRYLMTLGYRVFTHGGDSAAYLFES